MKTTIITLIGTLAIAVLLFCNPQPKAPTADICVAIAVEDQPRVFEAYGSILGLKDDSGNPRPATATEVSNASAIWIGSQTQDYERRKNMATFTPPPFSPGSGTLNGPAPTTAKPAKKK